LLEKKSLTQQRRRSLFSLAGIVQLFIGLRRIRHSLLKLSTRVHDLALDA